MTNLKRATDIAEELTKSQSWRARGQVAIAMASALLAILPVVGGPVQVLCEKLGGALVDPKLEAKFIEVCGLVALLEPDLAHISELQAQISGVAAVLAANQSLLDRVSGVLGQLHEEAASEFGVKSVGSRQDFINVTIKQMNVLIEAHQFGVNYLKSVRIKGGNVRFDSTSGGYQRVEDSTFTGRGGSSVGMHNLRIQGAVSTIGDHPEHPGIGLGPGGSIGFGSGGQIGFGPARRK